MSWKELFDSYLLPTYSVPKMLPELSFGIAGMCVHDLFSVLALGSSCECTVRCVLHVNVLYSVFFV